MKIRPINDGNSRFDLVRLSKNYKIPYVYREQRMTPHCTIHGAMNKVSAFSELPPRTLPIPDDYHVGGYWRCNVPNCRAGCIED